MKQGLKLPGSPRPSRGGDDLETITEGAMVPASRAKRKRQQDTPKVEEQLLEGPLGPTTSIRYYASAENRLRILANATDATVSELVRACIASALPDLEAKAKKLGAILDEPPKKVKIL